MTPVTWNAMTNDWEEPSADGIASSLMNKIETYLRIYTEEYVFQALNSAAYS